MKNKKIISKWRNAISVTEDPNGSFGLYRFSKAEDKWVKIIFFKDRNDIHNFIDWLDENFPNDDDDDEEEYDDDLVDDDIEDDKDDEDDEDDGIEDNEDDEDYDFKDRI